MILAIDIGNTNTIFALVTRKGVIKRRWSILTNKLTDDTNAGYLKVQADISATYIVSVVPYLSRVVKKKVRKKSTKKKVFIIGKDIKVPLKNFYNRKQIGQDRLIIAYAASFFYGKPALIIDFGTAMTFDYLSQKGEYLGGLILPGIKMSLDSLHERTALLPKTHLKKTSSFIGKNTVQSIRNGMIYGYGAICDGLIKAFRKRMGKKLHVVATGGDAALITGYAKESIKLDNDLSLKGLYLIAKSNNAF